MSISTLSTRLPIVLALPLTSCILVVTDSDWDHSVRGSGVRAEEDRQIGAFHAVDLETCATVVVRVGEAPSIHLSGDDNLLPLVQTEVENGVLSIELADSCSFRRGLELVIGTPSLERFTIEGSGDVRIEDVSAHELKLSIEGSGTIHARGNAEALTGSIEGSGSLNLAELDANSADLSIEGSGSMEVHVAKVLRYSIEGSGDIRYAGEPRVGGEIEGSGSVERLH